MYPGLRAPSGAVHLFVAACVRYRDARAAQSAAALAFALLFALVPLLVLARHLMELLPAALQFGKPLRAYLLGALLPDDTGAAVVRHSMRFVAKARRLSIGDLVVLIASAWVWVRTADHAINAMWTQSPQRRVRRTAMIHLALPVLAPVALGAGAAVSLHLVSASLGAVDEPAWLKVLLLRAAAMAVTAGCLVLRYRTWPRGRVVSGDAFSGALSATLLLALMQKGFSVYVAHMHGYTLVYGSLATLPVFLLWLYHFWSIVLFGAGVTAELGSAARQMSSDSLAPSSSSSKRSNAVV